MPTVARSSLRVPSPSTKWVQGQWPASRRAEAPRTRRWALHFSERRLLLLAGDLLLVGLALMGALWLCFSTLRSGFQSPYRLVSVKFYWWLVLWAIWLPISVVGMCYDLAQSASLVRGPGVAALCAGVVAGIYLVVPVISAPLTHSRLAWFAFALLSVVGIGAWRACYARFLARPSSARRLLVVGAGYSGRMLTRSLERLGQSASVQFVGYLDDDPALLHQDVAGHQVLATTGALEEVVDRERIDDVVVAITDPRRIPQALLDALLRCWTQGVSVSPMPLFFEETIGAVPVEHLGHNLFALVTSDHVFPHRLWDRARRLIDVVGAVVGLVALAILTPLIAAAIYLDCPGPIFYRQSRVGRGGRPFCITKYRSMIPNAEGNGAVWARRDDDRITRVGRILRRTRLDELPQFWSVLCGDMALIGPRPERPEFVAQLDATLPFYALRHAVRPGLTGWAQVRYPYGNTVQDALEKLQYDLYYVKHRSPVLDALILLHTLRVVLHMQGT